MQQVTFCIVMSRNLVGPGPVYFFMFAVNIQTTCWWTPRTWRQAINVGLLLWTRRWGSPRTWRQPINVGLLLWARSWGPTWVWRKVIYVGVLLWTRRWRSTWGLSWRAVGISNWLTKFKEINVHGWILTVVTYSGTGQESLLLDWVAVTRFCQHFRSFKAWEKIAPVWDWAVLHQVVSIPSEK